LAIYSSWDLIFYLLEYILIGIELFNKVERCAC